jgi:pimeloyl-ACP methyl ester carboxylesterase
VPADQLGGRPDSVASVELNHHRVGSGPPLVLLHGLGSRRQIWEPVIPALAERFDVVAPDLPGFGASPMPAEGTPPGVGSLAQLVAEFCARLGPGFDRPHVVGNSLGGLIALELARRERAASTTAISPAGFSNRAETVLARGTLWLTVRAARALSPWADRLTAPAAGRWAALGGFMAHPDRVPAAEAAADLRAFGAAAWFDATMLTVGPMAFSGGEEVRTDVPVTVAWGAKDRLLPPRQARRAARMLPRARVLLMAGCGHTPMYDDPEQVVRVIVDGTEAR